MSSIGKSTDKTYRSASVYKRKSTILALASWLAAPMDDGDGSSPISGACAGAGAASGLLPFFSRSPVEELEEKLRRLTEENQRLTGALDAILAGHHAAPHRPHAARSPSQSCATAMAPSVPTSCAAREDAAAEAVSKVRTIRVRADASDADARGMAETVKDGHQWKKYGQKVTRDNPYPRAYFRCASAPSCPVKKKVPKYTVLGAFGLRNLFFPSSS
ncbi:hypothetical protein GUJ93_ZPchr0002g24018 [Zizania palustris]|uniref:WRKY domain-containing protein n=1 Tax=Zizania palustris TaxID=103762 RepID=A0A8J5RSV5_ZIZPA|nr:hypothetical protein GUJ93_ZPchr0002g24018 [Zizania palustris]